MTELTVTKIPIKRGQRITQVARVPIAGATVEVPVITIGGVHDGPRVAVTGGIHGAEYVAIEAARRLGMSIDPQELSGTLVVVPISNTTAFFSRSIYTSGLDTNNLNRMFPGDAQGAPSQVLAGWLFRTIIQPSQYYIDMHGGDMIEALVPFVLAPQTGNAEVDALSLAMAEASGIERIIAGDVAGSTSGAAAAAGIPSILAEVGGQGVWREEEVAAHLESTLRVLRRLSLLPGDVPAALDQRTYRTFAWMRAETRGLFHPSVRVGEQVRDGQHLGQIVDYFGNPLQSVNAVTDGEVVFLVTSLAINAGDPLLALGA
ncbi:MAG TPA: succinylglutamate desuccinylase/aspartoacylase family protein [Chloroflexota bacterium]|nr:succinylglutamate desuccinylase/aspartoacylase family protein [Chloroflexota bacterium]